MDKATGRGEIPLEDLVEAVLDQIPSATAALLEAVYLLPNCGNYTEEELARKFNLGSPAQLKDVSRKALYAFSSYWRQVYGSSITLEEVKKILREVAQIRADREHELGQPDPRTVNNLLNRIFGPEPDEPEE